MCLNAVIDQLPAYHVECLCMHDDLPAFHPFRTPYAHAVNHIFSETQDERSQHTITRHSTQIGNCVPPLRKLCSANAETVFRHCGK